ncbi:MAG: hypothetical protein AAF770_01510 [Bacteroidota bacterium]
MPLTSWKDYMPILVTLDYVKIVKKLDEHLKKNRIGHFITYCIKQNGDSLQSNSICVESSGSGSLAAGTQLVLTELGKKMLWQQFRHFVKECYSKMKTIMTCTPHKVSLTKQEVGLVLFGLLRKATCNLTYSQYDVLNMIISYYLGDRLALAELASVSLDHIFYSPSMLCGMSSGLLIAERFKNHKKYRLYDLRANRFKLLPSNLYKIFTNEGISGDTKVSFHTMIPCKKDQYQMLVFNKEKKLFNNKRYEYDPTHYSSVLCFYDAKKDRFICGKEQEGAFLYGAFIDINCFAAWFVKLDKKIDTSHDLFQATFCIYDIPNNSLFPGYSYPFLCDESYSHNQHINDPSSKLYALFTIDLRPRCLQVYTPTQCVTFTYTSKAS